MKRALSAAAVASLLIVWGVGCEETDINKINNPGISGVGDANAPTTQGKPDLEKGRAERFGGAPGGGPPGGGPPGGGMPKGIGGKPSAITPDMLPPGYPRGDAAPGETPKKEGADAEKPAEDAAKPAEGEEKAAIGKEEMEQIAKLAEADQKLAIAQVVCLVSGEPLGSMGVPVRVEHEGKVGFLCCKGCRAQFDADPAKALAKTEK